MTSENKKPSKVVYDRTGTRYWCIPTTSNQTQKSNTNKIPDCCAAHQKEYLTQQSEKLYNYTFPNAVQNLETSQRIATEQDFDSPINLPKFQHPRRERSSSLPLPNELIMSNFLSYPGQQEDDTDNEDDYSYNDSDYDGFEFSHPLQGYLSESQDPSYYTSNDKKKSDNNVAVELNLDSLWRSKSIIEERDLSLKHFYSLSLTERKNVIKAQKDSETFLKGLSSKGRSKYNRNNYGKPDCNCSNCDPKRVHSEVDFEAFLTRCKMARTMVAVATSEQASDKASRDVQEAYEPDFSSKLKNKIFETATSFLEDNQTYLEISNRFLTEELKALAACPNKDPSDAYGDSADFPSEIFSNDSCAEDGDTVSSELSPTSSNFQAIAAQMISMNSQQAATKLPGLSFKNNPPSRNFTVSSSDYDSEHSCQEKCCLQQVSHIRGGEGDETNNPKSDERFRSIMEKATDYDSLVKIYVTKIFDHRILNHFQEKQIQIKQQKLIEEFQKEEKKTKQKPKKEKKKTKNNKQYEEMLARKREEARLEEESRRLREAEAKKAEERRQREEEELAARVEKAREINRQAKEEAEKLKKAAIKPTAPSRSILNSGLPTSSQLPSKTSHSGIPAASSHDSLCLPSHSKPSQEYTTPVVSNPTPTKPNAAATSSKVVSVSVPPLVTHPQESNRAPSHLSGGLPPIRGTPQNQMVQPRLLAGQDLPRLLPAGNNDSDWPSLQELPSKTSPTRTSKRECHTEPKGHPGITSRVKPLAKEVPAVPLKRKDSSVPASKDHETINATSPPLSSLDDFTTSLSWALSSTEPLETTSSFPNGAFSSTFPQPPPFNTIPPYVPAQFSGFKAPPNLGYPNGGPIPMNMHMSSTPDRLQAGNLGNLPRPLWNESFYRNAPPCNSFDLNRRPSGWSTGNNLAQPMTSKTVHPTNFTDHSDAGSVMHPVSFPGLPSASIPPPPSLDSLPGISLGYIMDIQDNIRHSYFTLLLGMGLDLTIHPHKRPFVPIEDLYMKYKSLFNSRIDSLLHFHQMCSYQTLPSGSSIPTNAFQFQASPNQPNILIRYSLSFMPTHEMYPPPTASFLSLSSSPWELSHPDSSVGGMVGADPLPFSPLPSDLFSQESHPSPPFGMMDSFPTLPAISHSTHRPSVYSTGSSPFVGDTVV